MTIFLKETPNNAIFFSLENTRGYFGRMSGPISWAAVAAAPPNLKTPEVRVLKRIEPLPTAAAAIASTPLPPRIRRRALRAQRNPRRGGHLTELMKERMLLRYRSLLAQTITPRRRGKERLMPKKKPHSHLKAGILGDRLVRSMLRQQAHPCEEQSALTEAARNVVVSSYQPDLLHLTASSTLKHFLLLGKHFVALLHSIFPF